MKKKVKKLVLTKETVRELKVVEAAAAFTGGSIHTLCNESCPTRD